jgi:sulfur carrier protein ThiS
MDVFIEKTNETKELPFTGTVQELLKQLSINPEEVLVIRNNTLLTDDVELTDKDSIKLMSVVSGG